MSRGWYVAFVGFVAMIAGTPVGPTGYGAFIPAMSADLGWGRDLLAAAAAVGTIAGGAVAPWVGAQIDRHGARAVMTASGIGLAVSYFGTSLVPADAPALFFLAYGLGRMIDMAAILLGATVAVSALFTARRGRAIALVLIGNPAGVLLLVPLIQAVIAASGWRTAWQVLAVLGIVLAVLARTLIRDHVRIDEEALAPAAPAWTVRTAVRTWPFWALLLSAALGQAAFSAAGTHQIAALQDNGLDPASAAAAVAAFAATWGAGQLVWGLVVERLPARYVLAAGYVLMGLALVLLTTANTFAQAVAFALLLGIALSDHETVDAVAWADTFGTRALGAIRGAGRPLFLVGNAAGAFAAGAAYEATGSYAPAFLSLAALSTVGAVLVTSARGDRARA